MNKTKNPLLDNSETNEYYFNEMLKKFKPELYVLMDLLDQTGVNYFIIYKTIRQLYNLATGTRYGKVEIEVINGVATYVRGQEQDKLLEPVLRQDKEKEN